MIINIRQYGAFILEKQIPSTNYWLYSGYNKILMNSTGETLQNKRIILKQLEL